MNQKSTQIEIETDYSNSMAHTNTTTKKELLTICVSELKNTNVYGAENLKSLHTFFFNMTNFFRNMPSLRKTKLIIDADFGKAYGPEL